MRWYESAGVIPPATRQPNGYREYAEEDLARLRLVVSLRRLGLGPEDAGRMARLCLERGEVDRDLEPLIADQRAAIARQRDDLDRLDGELIDLEATIADAGRARGRRKERPMSEAPIRVLFVCTGNSARSQIAEAVLGRIGGADFEVFSAGVEPKGVNPFTIRVLDDAGIDWSRRGASPWTSTSASRSTTSSPSATVRGRPVRSSPASTTPFTGGSKIQPRSTGTDAQKLAAFQRTYMEVNQRIRPFVRSRPAGRRANPPFRHRRLKSLPLGPALVAEAIGTFALVFAGCGAIAVGTLGPAGVAAAFGLAIMVMVYALGHVSGAHFNPAVTSAFAVGRHFPLARVLPYWAAQVAGAIAGASLLRATLGNVPLGVTQPAGSDVQALVWEVVLTFFLMLVIVAVATDTRAVGQGAAIAIGGTVALGSLGRRPDQRRLDEPGPLRRPRARQRRPIRPVDLPRGAAGRRGRRDPGLPLSPTRGLGARLNDREPTRGGRQGDARAEGAGELAEALDCWGRSEYQIQVPRRSPSIQPASRRTLRWCETVGWLTSQQEVKSQAQTSAQSLNWRRMASRVGSAAAWSSRTSGSVWRFISSNVLTDVYIVKYQYSDHGPPAPRSTPAMTTETIHETVRQHYADAAVRASQGSSCCSDPETIGANLVLGARARRTAGRRGAGVARLRQPDGRRGPPSGRASPGPRVRRRHRRPPLGEAGRADRPGVRGRHDRRDAGARPGERRRGRRHECRVPEGPHRGAARCPPSRSTSSSATASSTSPPTSTPSSPRSPASSGRAAGSGSATSWPRTR